MSPDDLDDALRLVKSAKSIPVEPAAPVPLPLSAEHVLHRPAGAPPVILGSVSDVRNAMLLASGQKLSFAVDGITIIYGENGSGKSGYCKLLKQICRARRDRSDEVVLQNAYKPDTKAKPSLKVTFKIGDSSIDELEWDAGQAPPEALSRITIFDSRLAPLYADRQDKIEFLPAGLDVLPRFAKACEELIQRLGSEMEPIKKVLAAALPEMVPDTVQAASVALLFEKTAVANIPSAEQYEELGRWTEEDAAKLARIEREIGADPAARAREKERGAKLITAHLAEMKGASDILAADKLAGFDTSIGSYLVAQRAADLAASVEFKEDIFAKVIGSSPWRQMFSLAAQIYAATFDGAELPEEGPAQFCPLCAQELQPPAFSRLKRFRELVAGVAERDAVTKLHDLTAAIVNLKHLKIPTPEQVISGLTPFAAEGDADASLLIEVADWFRIAEARRTEAVRAGDSNRTQNYRGTAFCHGREADGLENAAGSFRRRYSPRLQTLSGWINSKRLNAN